MNIALLDTDTLSEILRRRVPTILLRSRAYLAQYARFTFSAMSQYEVVRGYREKNATTQLARLDIICQSSEILPINEAILDRAADLWVTSRRGGHSNADADLIIAASALVHERVLVTGNTPHFAWIPGLRLENWR
jgi:tRNA(fMet)-specific endonuclease VapC